MNVTMIATMVVRRAGVGQGYRGAGQEYRVPGYAPSPDDGGDAERGVYSQAIHRRP
jgi:hypothetical protein